MNADKLFKTAQIIKSEIDTTQSLANLGNVVSSLSTLVGNPHPQHISQFNQFVINFRSGFQNTKYESLGSADKQLIEELGVSDLIGNSLLEKIGSSSISVCRASHLWQKPYRLVDGHEPTFYSGAWP